MKKVSYFVLLLFCLAFMSCGGEITVSIYTRDLSDIMQSKENMLYTTATMIVEGLNDERDIAFLRRNIHGFSHERTVEYNYSTSLSFDVKIPILKAGTNGDFSNDLLIITGKESDGKTEYSLRYNKNLFSRINAYVYSEHFQNIDVREFKIKLELYNDERKAVSLTTYSSYVNGRAYPFLHQEVLNERGRTVLEVSEVFRNYIATMDDDMYPVFSIK